MERHGRGGKVHGSYIPHAVIIHHEVKASKYIILEPKNRAEADGWSSSKVRMMAQDSVSMMTSSGARRGQRWVYCHASGR